MGLMMREVPWFYIGVDLGQVSDYTAIVVVERILQEVGPDGRPNGMPEQQTYYHPLLQQGPKISAQLHVRHLERLPLGMSYVDQVEHIKNLVEHPELQSYYVRSGGFDPDWDEPLMRRRAKEPPGLAVDATGVGRAVVNQMRSRGLELDAVVLHGGDSVSHADGYTRLPKRDLVGLLQVNFQSGWLKIAEDLELADTLRQELLNFKMKIDPQTAHDSYSHWRENAHDDLVLATGMAAWAAIKEQRRFWGGTYNFETGEEEGMAG
jgi:hypothetical protein